MTKKQYNDLRKITAAIEVKLEGFPDAFGSTALLASAQAGANLRASPEKKSERLRDDDHSLPRELAATTGLL